MSSVQAQAVSGWGRPRQRRILVAAYATALHGQTRDCSPRQLPTNHDHDGEPCARSTNIRVINRRHALPRLLFTCAWLGIKKVRKRSLTCLTGRSISGSRIAVLAISVWAGSIQRCALYCEQLSMLGGRSSAVQLWRARPLGRRRRSRIGRAYLGGWLGCRGAIR
jgi:hypothetical protein